MPARRRQMRIPGGLPVVVGVDVDEAGCHQTAPGIDFTMAFAFDHADFGDASIVDGDIGLLARCAAAVDDGAAADHGLMSVHKVSWVVGAPLQGYLLVLKAALVPDCQLADPTLSSRAARALCTLTAFAPTHDCRAGRHRRTDSQAHRTRRCGSLIRYRHCLARPTDASHGRHHAYHRPVFSRRAHAPQSSGAERRRRRLHLSRGLARDQPHCAAAERVGLRIGPALCGAQPEFDAGLRGHARWHALRPGLVQSEHARGGARHPAHPCGWPLRCAVFRWLGRPHD